MQGLSAHLLARVVLSREVHVTLITTTGVYHRVKTELSRAFGPQDTRCLDLIRLVGLDDAVDATTNPTDVMREQQNRFLTGFASAFERLVAGRSVTCSATHIEVPALSAPNVVVIDFLVSPLVHSVLRVGKGNVKILVFGAAMVSYTYLTLAPLERGGRAGFKTKVLEEAQRSGRPVEVVVDEIYHIYTDEVMQIPGFPKMYHWEFDPQDTRHLTKGLVGGLWMSLLAVYDACDGLIVTSPEVYEPDAIKAIREWFSESGKRSVWAIGPLLPSSASKEAVAGEEVQSESSGAIKQFMDDTLTSHGAHSMLYISFGSAFWPSRFDLLEAFIDTVIELKIPFILSHGSPLAHLSDSFKAKVEQCGLGLLSRWSPQQTILIHPALGWFVTHGGHNSILEAVSSGVPMICWPFHADQPANAVLLTEVHNVAYELIEVRTGNGLKPRFRTGKAPLGTLEAVKAEAQEVLQKAFGEDGAKKRTNVKKLRGKIETAWDENGSAKVDMALFLSTL